MGKHKKTLIYYNFAVKLWAEGYSDGVIMDAIMEKYAINITNFNSLIARNREDFPYRTKEQISLNKSTGIKISLLTRERKRRTVEKALIVPSA